MPELPELEVVRDVLDRRVIGETITNVQLFQPGAAIVIRDLTGAGAERTLANARFETVARRGKFLVLTCSVGAETLYMVINPKLTGRLQLATAKEKKMAKTHLTLSLAGGIELRYVDQKQMGQVYLTHKPPAEAGIPDFADLGPEPFDVTLDEFRQRLRKFQGEIKGILIRGEFIAGIGNAYADEILWEAKLHPYRKRTSLNEEEIVQLYEGMRTCLRNAIEQVRSEMGESIHLKPRDFLNVHMKTNHPCPRCGGMISEVTANQRITNFCRTCQPGGLIKGM
ncbi:MAG: DNA-formamidopyrimidine glycosylase family protein [Caldilineaceae bacterium]